MLSVILWWLVIQLLGLAALPLTWRLFARLPGRGYPFAKALGLLLVSHVLWLGAIFHLLPNDLGGTAVALFLVAGASAWLGRDAWRRGADGVRPLVAWLRDNRWLVLATELLFLVVFAGWAVFRAYNPEISGTEKPMEFAFINGVLRSRFFPPQDPWLSGYGISYYYFGYVMLALLIRLTGVLPEVGFNLGVALWYALVMVGAFGIVYDLVRLAGNRKLEAGSCGPETRSTQHAARSTSGDARAIGYGLLGALFVGVVGNLQGFIDSLYQRGVLAERFVRWLDIKGMFDAPPTGNWTGGFWWWWRASRVIHDKDLLGNSVEVIDEFPFFSFLLGDMHPHVLALPFALLAIGLAANLLLVASTGACSGRKLPAEASIPADFISRITHRAAGFWRSLGTVTGLGGPGIFLSALVLGALGFLNTWDFPIYVGLAALALGIGWASVEGLTWRVAGRAAAAGVVLALLGWLLYLPFYLGFQSQLGGALPNLLFPSRFSQFFVMFGLFLVAAAFFLALLSRGRGRAVLRGMAITLPVTLLTPVLLMAAVALGLAVLPNGRLLVEQALNAPGVQANVSAPTLGGLLGLAVRLRVATPWTWLALAVLIAWAAGVLWAGMRGGGDTETRRQGDQETGRYGDGQSPRQRVTASPLPLSPSPHLPVSDLFAVALIGLALLLTLVPEFVYLRDLFGTRMNTVFKFYYQAWVMLALVAAYGVSRLTGRGTPLALKGLGLSLVAALTVAGLWYPLLAAPSKADNFQVNRESGDPRPTLDGLASLRRFDPATMAAIEWLRVNVPPDAVVVEASGGSYTQASQVSMATGNPTLLGWDFHERQWRGNEGYDKLAAGRPEALDQIYRTARPEELPALLDRWGVDYVFVGNQERSKYQIGDPVLARFDRALTLVYDVDGVRIYAR